MRLQKLKNYCVYCKFQCKDHHGYKNHIRTSRHKLNDVQYNGRKLNEDFTTQYMKKLHSLAQSRPINSNTVYNAIIAEPNHLRLKDTTWITLTSFLKHLERLKKISVESWDAHDIIIVENTNIINESNELKTDTSASFWKGRI